MEHASILFPRQSDEDDDMGAIYTFSTERLWPVSSTAHDFSGLFMNEFHWTKPRRSSDTSGNVRIAGIVKQ